jgi:hypothetical protein
MITIDPDRIPKVTLKSEGIDHWTLICEGREIARGLSEYLARMFSAAPALLEFAAKMARSATNAPTKIPAETLLRNHNLEIKPLDLTADFVKPFWISEHEDRSYICDAKGRVVTEVVPGQFRGMVPSAFDIKGIAKQVCQSLNDWQPQAPLPSEPATPSETPND